MTGTMLVDMTFTLAIYVLVLTAEGYICETSVKRGMNNYGPGVSDEAVEDSTPLQTGAYNAIVAFDESHCIKMCCEQEECHIAVFNSEEAVCYLKAAGALAAYHDVAADHVSSYTIERRIGDYQGVELSPRECRNKRGVAYGFKDVAALNILKNGLSWWYDWSPGMLDYGVLKVSMAQGSEYVPMIWGEGDLTEARLRHLSWIGKNSSYLLGFNEPNFGSQAKLTAQEAAQLWSKVRLLAEEYGMDLVSPAVNYCYGDCIEEDPIQWLDDFFEECRKIEGGCGIKYIAVHSYACEVRYLNKHIHSYTSYGLPIWLTEFACAFEAIESSEANQAEYLSGALTYLEMNPHIFRYAWFTAISSQSDGVMYSGLLNSSTGQLTAVGQVFVTEYIDLQHCRDEDLIDSSVESVVSTDDDSLMSTGMEQETEVELEIGLGLETDSKADDRLEPTIDAPVPLMEVEDHDEASSDIPDVFFAESEDGLDVNSNSEVITSVVITNVGGSGYFDVVVKMIDGENGWCPSFEDTCVNEEVCVTGDLAPFDEVSVAFRGPMNIYNIAWYEGTAEGILDRTSSWTPGTKGDNMVFMKNLGGVNGCSGEWSICGGNSQSYADASGGWCSSEPQAFSGSLDGDNEINIMTSWECSSEAQCGFYRDVGMRGWQGGKDGTKVMVFRVDMPHCEGENCAFDRPAVWVLNAMVLRTAQYGCNCRGIGGNGGCGEFDILEAIIGNPYSDMLFTHVYDFKGTGSPGQSKYFKRPLEESTYAAVFRGGGDSYLQVIKLGSWDFDSKTLTTETLDHMRGSISYDIYDVDPRHAPSGCLSDPEILDTDEGIVELGEAEGYEYVGCFSDAGLMAAQEMPLYTERAFQNNEPSMCATRCAEVKGATFFGLEDGNLCWCGGIGYTGLRTVDGDGEAVICDTSCPGSKNVACGGSEASSVYVLPVNHTYVGCYADMKSDRDMLLVQKVVSDYLTPAVCAAFCSSVDNAVYFGVQDGRKCFCGDAFGKHGVSAKCDYPCMGDESQVCGAQNVNSIYALGPMGDADTVLIEGDWGTPDEEDKVCGHGGRCGCFLDSPPKSLLKGVDTKDSTSMTKLACRTFCKHGGYPFYGLEWSLMCLCGGEGTDQNLFLEDLKDFKLDERLNACDMPCSGNVTETCGGENTVEIWQV